MMVERIIKYRKKRQKEILIILVIWRRRSKKVVSFYGKSSSTAQNGHHIHPQGNQPSNRMNYSDLTLKSQGQGVKKN